MFLDWLRGARIPGGKPMMTHGEHTNTHGAGPETRICDYYIFLIARSGTDSCSFVLQNFLLTLYLIYFLLYLWYVNFL